MYIQITNRCNMHCPHCCFDCKAKGVDMDIDTFKAALKLNDTLCKQGITIGGGEPTLHPQLFEYIDLTICSDGVRNFVYENGCDVTTGTYLVTNGSRYKESMKLIMLAELQQITVRFSFDQWHSYKGDYDKVKPELRRYVADVIKRQKGFYVDRTIDSYMVSPSGRAKSIDKRQHKPESCCCCRDIMIMADGNLYACDCMLECFGNIKDFVKQSIKKQRKQLEAVLWQVGDYCSKTKDETLKEIEIENEHRNKNSNGRDD